jgi:hypothetical protein
LGWPLNVTADRPSVDDLMSAGTGVKEGLSNLFSEGRARPAELKMRPPGWRGDMCRGTDGRATCKGRSAAQARREALKMINVRHYALILLSFWYHGRRPCPSALAPRLCSSPHRRGRSSQWHDVCLRGLVYGGRQRCRGACRPRGPPGDDGHRTLAVRLGSSTDGMPGRRAPHRRGGHRAAGNEALPGQARSTVWAVAVRLGSPGRTSGG